MISDKDKLGVELGEIKHSKSRYTEASLPPVDLMKVPHAR